MFKTSELFLIASLVYLGYETKGMEVDNEGRKRVYFLFEDGGQLRIDIDRYWAKELRVCPLKLNLIIRELKSKIYNA